MTDPVFGEIVFDEDYGFEGSYVLPFFGHDVTVRLGVPTDEDIDPIQREALERFTDQKAELCRQAGDVLYAHYRGRLNDLREQFGDSADKLMPILASETELPRLVSPRTILVAEPLGSNDRVIGLLYDCTWDPELGLGVKFVNEAIVAVGSQDVVL